MQSETASREKKKERLVAVDSEQNMASDTPNDVVLSMFPISETSSGLGRFWSKASGIVMNNAFSSLYTICSVV